MPLLIKRIFIIILSCLLVFLSFCLFGVKWISNSYMVFPLILAISFCIGGISLLCLGKSETQKNETNVITDKTAADSEPYKYAPEIFALYKGMYFETSELSFDPKTKEYQILTQSPQFLEDGFSRKEALLHANLYTQDNSDKFYDKLFLYKKTVPVNELEYITYILNDYNTRKLFCNEDGKFRSSKNAIENFRFRDEFYPKMKEAPFECAAKNLYHRLIHTVPENEKLKRVFLDYYFDDPLAMNLIFCTEKMYQAVLEKYGKDAAENSGDYNTEETYLPLTHAVGESLEKALKGTGIRRKKVPSMVHAELAKLLETSKDLHFSEDFKLSEPNEYD